MSEKLLHFIWQHKLFIPNNLTTTDGQEIEVLDVGKLNSDAGPDFFNAKIKIGETTWAGNVEIHINASDWEKHKHHTDKAYDSVILHLVAVSDKAVQRTNGEKIPQAVLLFPEHIEKNYLNIKENKSQIPCANKLQELDSFLLSSWLHACLTERLSQKADKIFSLLSENNNNWEEAFYITLARNFGFGKNNDAFERLAKSIPLSYLGKHKNNLLQIEAILFGQSGLLKEIDTKDDYVISLEKEYKFLKSKFNLSPLDKSIWKLLRLRPSNFPHVRIAQFAGLIHQSSKLFSKIIENPKLDSLNTLFQCEPSSYWQTHYLFGEESPEKGKKIGKKGIEIILINTVVPFLFCYGKSQDNIELREKAINLLEEIPSEKNSIINQWQELGINSKSAYDSQALIQLKTNYCDNKNCLRCRIGHKVLSIENENGE